MRGAYVNPTQMVVFLILVVVLVWLVMMLFGGAR
jgi:hypothetical protein